MLLRFLLLSALIIACQCFRKTRELPDVFKQKPEWDDLRVKWGFNPFDENNFQSLPRRESDAKDARFELLRDECKEMEKGKERRVPLFKGKRYWKNKDPSVVVIYDANGYIAGVQAGIPKSAFENKNLQKKLKEKSNEEERPVLHRRRRLADTDQIKTALAEGTIFGKRFPSMTEEEYLNIKSVLESYRKAIQSLFHKSAFENKNLIEEERPVLHRRRRLADTDQIKTALEKGDFFEKRRLPIMTRTRFLKNEVPNTSRLRPYDVNRFISEIQSLISKRIFLNEELMNLRSLRTEEDYPYSMQNLNDLKRMKRHTDTSLDLQETSESSSQSAPNGTTRQSKQLPSTLHSRKSTPSSTENVFKKTTLSSGNSRSHERTRTFPETGQASESTAQPFGTSKAPRFPTARKAFWSGAKLFESSETPTQQDIFPPRYDHPKHEYYRSRFLRKAAKQLKKPHDENSETKSPSMKPTSNSPLNPEGERRMRSVGSMEMHHPVTHNTERHHPESHNPVMHNHKMHHPVTHPFVEEDVIFFTIYFIDPEHICDPKHSRNIDHIEHWGTGSGLFIHNGTNSNSFIQIPRDERDLQLEGPWKPEKCLFTQGQMYSYNFHENETCHNLCPLLLYYNRGRLTGFALLFKMDYSSPYVEHPDKGLLRFMFEKVPKCYYEIGRLTKLHFFLTSNYLSHRC